MTEDKGMFNRDEWITTECWIACFDILGFKKLVSFEGEEMKALQVMYRYDETLKELEKSCRHYSTDGLDFVWLSDTFVMFTPDDSAASYVVIQDAAQSFVVQCIYNALPLRGAISAGQITRRRDNRAFMGKGFVDSFEYAEDQDWIGLILTPYAIEKTKSYGGSSIRDFVRSENVPMRKFKSEDVLAYRFQNGAQNFSSPLLPMLQSMKSRAGDQHRDKYERTIEFIKCHYSYMV